MSGKALTFDEPLVLVGGSDVNTVELEKYLHHPVVAVDGGANALAHLGRLPEALMGDFDSIKDETYSSYQSRNVQIIATPDQNYTDLEKALALLDAPKIFGFGFLDGRIDHALNAMVQLSKNDNLALIGLTDRMRVLRSNEPVFIEENCRVSFASFGQTKAIKSKGLVWPLENTCLTPQNMSISNKTNALEFFVDYEGDPLIMILPAETREDWRSKIF